MRILAFCAGLLFVAVPFAALLYVALAFTMLIRLLWLPLEVAELAVAVLDSLVRPLVRLVRRMRRAALTGCDAVLGALHARLKRSIAREADEAKLRRLLDVERQWKSLLQEWASLRNHLRRAG